MLREVLRRRKRGIQYVEHVEGDGARLVSAICHIGMEGSLQRDLMHPIDQENRGRGSKSKIRNPRLPPGPTMVRSEYSLLSVVRRSGSAAQAKHTTKNRKMMATNATALCTRVISISNAQQCSPRLREINNPLSLSVTVLRHRVQSFRD